jgi:hypothetical protein
MNQPKYYLLSKVYFMLGNKARHGTVEEVHCMRKSGQAVITYSIEWRDDTHVLRSIIKPEDDLYQTKEELLASL